MASRLGSVVNEAMRTLPTPNATSRPRLYIPRWLEIIKLPKPTMVVSAARVMALAVLLASGTLSPSYFPVAR